MCPPVWVIYFTCAHPAALMIQLIWSEIIPTDHVAAVVAGVGVGIAGRVKVMPVVCVFHSVLLIR